MPRPLFSLETLHDITRSAVGHDAEEAFAVILDPEINVLLASVPAIAMVICFSDIIHLCSAYLHELGRGFEKDEAILSAASDVGVACLFTSVTTFVGFISLMFVPTPAFRQLGAVLGFGVASALMLALTLVPIVLPWSSARYPKPF